jgi:hypothetical protein
MNFGTPGPGFFIPMEDSYGQGKSWFLVNEEQLREKIVELSPEIRRETGRMEDLIREMVKLEREKTGLDDPRGNINLALNKNKKGPKDPDFIGAGRIAGRVYQVGAWISQPDKLKISLLPPRRKND